MNRWYRIVRRALSRRWARFAPVEKALAFAGFMLIAGSAGGAVWHLHRSLLTEVPAHGGSLREALVGTPRFINPILADLPAERAATALVFSGLTRLTPTGHYALDLASSLRRIATSSDEVVYRATIAADAQFHDGTPVTAEDVVFTYTLARHPLTMSPHAARLSEVAAHVRGSREVEFVFPPGTTRAAVYETLRMGILPAHLWRSVPPEGVAFASLNLSPIGAGPFRVVNVERDSLGIPQTMRLAATSHHHKTPYLASIEFRFYPTLTAARDALARKEVDALGSLSSPLWQSLSAARRRELARYEAPTSRLFAVFYQPQHAPILRTTAARRGLDLLIDRRHLIQEVLHGDAYPAEGPLPPFQPPSSLWTPTAATSSATRREEAARAFRSAGWVWREKEQRWYPSNDAQQPVQLTITTSNIDPLPAVAAAIARMWRNAGIEVTVRALSPAVLARDVIRPRLYEVLLFGMVVGRDEDLSPFWHSSQRNDPGLNIASYTNLRVDRALEAARSATSTAARRRALEQVAAILRQEMPASFLFTPLYRYVVDRSVRGVVLPPRIVRDEERYVTVARWYRDTEALWPFLVPLLSRETGTSSSDYPAITE